MTSFSGLALLLAKSTLVVCLGFGGTWLLRKRSGAARHTVWTAALAVLVAILAVAPLSPWKIGMPAFSNGNPLVLPAVSTPSSSPTVARPQTSPTIAAPVHIAPPSAAKRAARAFLAVNWTRKLLWLWWIGIALVAMRQIVARVQLSQLSRRAKTGDEDSKRRFEQIAQQAGITRPVTLLVSDEVDVPLTWGIFNARVLLPSNYQEWESRRLNNVIHHELAHVRRLDVLTALLGDAACALYWFNPLVWRAATQMRIEREIACDEAVLETGAKASDYATDLVDLAINVRFGSLHRAGLAIAGCPRFEQRVKAIVDGIPRTGMTRIATAAVLAAMVAVLPLAAFQIGNPTKFKSWPVPSQRVLAFHGEVATGFFDRMVQDATADPSLVNTRGREGQSPLSLALGSASKRGPDEAWWLILHGADVNAQESGMGMTPLMHAVRHPDLLKLLLERGADPNARDLYERTPLDYVAMLGGNDQSADLLLAHGAQMKFIDAVLLGRVEDVRAVLNKDPGLIDSVPSFPPGGFMRETPLEYAAQCMGRSPKRCGPMVDLLGSYTPEPNLFQATILGRIDRMRELLDADPSRIRETDGFRRSALDWAVQTQRTETAKFLLERGAEPTFAMLNMAVHDGNKPMVELLLAHGAPRRNDQARGSANSALLLRDWAANNGHPEIAALLK